MRTRPRSGASAAFEADLRGPPHSRRTGAGKLRQSRRAPDGVGASPDMRSMWLYLGGLLLAIVGINVLVMRTIRAEKRRQREERGSRSSRR